MNDVMINPPLQEEGSDRKRESGLRRPQHLARRPVIGLLMVLLGGVMFGVIVIGLQTNAPVMQLDILWINTIHTMALQSSPFMRTVMISGFYVGEHVIVAIGVILALYFLYKRFWPELCMVVIAWAGEGGIWLYLSAYFNRPRPVFEIPVWHQMTAPGFPSGHSISAVMCYGLLAYLLAPRIHSHLGKALVIIVAVLVILFIGYSRIFVGDHYPTDVLAGYALGIAWSGFVYTLVELMSYKKVVGYVEEK
jgi:undecaprenyl-diphosphatase